METHEMIKFLREKLGLSQESLALQVGYRDRSSIAKIEAGLVDLSQSKIALFAKALGVSPAELVSCEDLSCAISSVTPTPTPVSESGRVNIVKLAGRDGSYLEKRLSDAQLSALKSMVEQLPDVPDDL